MQTEFYVKLQLTEVHADGYKNVEREIDGSNLIMDNGEVALTEREQRVELEIWMLERGFDQHGCDLYLRSWTLHRYQ